MDRKYTGINKILWDQGSKFSSLLGSGIKNLRKNTGSATKKYISLRPWKDLQTIVKNELQNLYNWFTANKLTLITLKNPTLQFLFTHFPETRVQRNVSYKLNGSNSKKLKGRYAKLIFSVETIHVVKKTQKILKINPQVYTIQEGMQLRD